MSAPTVASLQRQVAYKERARRYAWAKFFEAERDYLEDMTTNYQTIVRVVESEEIPAHIIEELRESMVAMKKSISCPICLEIIAPDTLAVSKCGHKYCKTCLDELKVRDPKCALCRKKL
jgi:hypothetical protein